MDISPPKRASAHGDRQLDCREAIEPSFQALIDAAEQAGWKGDEIAYALLALAAAYFRERAAVQKQTRR